MNNRLLLLTGNYDFASEFKHLIPEESVSFDSGKLENESIDHDPNTYDLIILDLTQSEQTNREKLSYLRSITDQPIFVVLKEKSEIVRSYYLELGADGIIDLPLRKIETRSLIRALLRRMHAIESLNMDEAYHFGGCTYHPHENIIRTPVSEVVLTLKEGQLLNLFVQNMKRVVSRERIFRYLYPLEHSASDNALNILVTRLRKKMRDHDCPCPNLIQTISGVGYRMNVDSN